MRDSGTELLLQVLCLEINGDGGESRLEGDRQVPKRCK